MNSISFKQSSDAQIDQERRLRTLDIAGYSRDIVHGIPWWKQEEAFRLLQTPPYKLLIRSGHNVGKSWLAANVACHSHECKRGLTIITAPTKYSLQDILFTEIRRIRPQLQGLFPKATRAEVRPGWAMYGYTASSGEAFAGRHAEKMTFIYDEATGIDPIYFEVGKGMFTGAPGHSWVCTYNPTDQASQVYHEECSNDWHVLTISQLEHPNIEAELRGEPPPYPSAVRLQQVIDQLNEYATVIPDGADDQPGQVQLGRLRWMPGPLADIRVLGRWPRSGGDTVWSDDLWDNVKKCRHDLNPAWKVQIGCDVARYGFDFTCIVVKQGPCVLHLEKHNGWSTKQTAERLRQLCHQFSGPHEPREVPVLIDGVGVGGGVVDQADGYLFVDVQAGAKSLEERKYYNLRSELWFVTTDHAKAGLLDISRIAEKDQTTLRSELLAVKYDVDPAERMRVEPKLATRATLKRSPDLADAFNLACYWVHEG
jgi:hypothetical protein